MDIFVLETSLRSGKSCFFFKFFSLCNEEMEPRQDETNFYLHISKYKIIIHYRYKKHLATNGIFRRIP